MDIVEIGRIASLIERYPDHFINKVFTAEEITFCNSKAFPATHFAGRWAAKEAFYKALPREIQSRSSWKSVQIVADPASGGPYIDICDDILKQTLVQKEITRHHLSISHERGMCVAMVVLE